MQKSLSFLFATIEGGGNIPAVFGLARRLARRGHRVRVLTEPCLRDAVESSGLALYHLKNVLQKQRERKTFSRTGRLRL